MSTITDLYRQRQATSLTSCTPQAPVCFTCGMLECVCRPRFFAGQVLQADDLNRLDAYIRAKNRLHNRQLNGWGVVNGLEVTCNPCGAGVTVGCGYALSPCGEDIVVCNAVTVDVCSLIARCKDAENQVYACDPPNAYANAGHGCDALDEEWVLAIRYAETPAKGVKPLYASGNGGCGCGAGTQSATGGCGCGSASACSCNSTKPRGAPVQCEASVICEGFSFDVYRAPSTATNRNPTTGAFTPASTTTAPLLLRFECCIQALTAIIPQKPAGTAGSDPAAWKLWAVRLKANLLKYLQTNPGYNCDLTTQLGTLAITDPANDPAGFQAAITTLQTMFVDALIACFCSALLPPCPMPTGDVRVPIALLHMNAQNCSVLRVCNWSTQRKFATTFPALQYWLGVLPFMNSIRELLQNACCADLSGLFARGNDRLTRTTAARMRSSPNTPATAPDDATTLRLNPMLKDPAAIQDMVGLLTGTLFSRNSPLTADALFNALSGATQSQDGGGGLSAVQAAHLPQFLALHELVKPIIEASGTTGLTGMLGAALQGSFAGARAAAAAPTAPSATDDVAALRKDLASLRETVASQTDQINELKTRRGKR